MVVVGVSGGAGGRGEGQLSPLMLRRHSDRWLTGLRASGSICGQQQQRWRGGEEHLIHFLFPPCDFFSIGAGRTKGGQLHDYRRQRAPSSRLQAGLAWCSIQPASLCGRALHASEDPLSNPGLGESLGFLPGQVWKTYSPSVGRQQAAALSALTAHPDSGFPARSIPAGAHGYTSSPVCSATSSFWQEQEAIDE